MQALKIVNPDINFLDKKRDSISGAAPSDGKAAQNNNDYAQDDDQIPF